MSKEKRTLTPTSDFESDASPILLSEDSSFRLSFFPFMTRGSDHTKSNIYGEFVWQRKKPNDKWENVETYSLTDLAPGKTFSQVLSIEQMNNFLSGIKEYVEYLKRRGFPVKQEEFLTAPANMESAINLIASIMPKDSIASLVKDIDADIFQRVASGLNSAQMNNSLSELESGLSENHKEAWWQSKLSQNPWILGQVFTQSYVLLQDQAYVGGKTISNKHGVVADYLFKNDISNNVAIIEIKKPTTRLLHSSSYGDDIYGLSNGLNSAVTQILNQKDQLVKNHQILQEQNKKFLVFNPKCILIAGLSDQLDCDEKRTSFELRRSSYKEIEFVTFDELIRKCKTVLMLLSNLDMQDFRAKSE